MEYLPSLRFPSGATHLMIGISGSGKTYRMIDILRNKNLLFENGKNIKNIIFCYADWQDAYTDLRKEGIVNTWINKMPSNEEFVNLVEPFRYKGGSIVIIDDFMNDMDKDIKKIVMNSAGHYKASTFLLVQSLCPSDSKVAREISLNSKYIHIFKNPRDNYQFSHLARQLRPNNYKWLVKVYHNVTEEPFTCLLIDLLPRTKEYLRFRSHYLPHEFPMRAYKNKNV